MRFRHRLTVIRVRGGGLDRRGVRQPDQRMPLDGFAFAPGVSTENLAHREAVETKGELFGPYGVDLVPQDKVELPAPHDGRWHVIGWPQQWGPNPFTGKNAGSVTRIERY